MTQPQLARTCFPLSGLSKPEVRRHAAEAGLENAKKPESQDICFVRNGDYAAFIEEYAKRVYPPGDFVDLDGKALGRHCGIVRYTVGQRKGLGVALGRPVYVSEIRPETNEVVLADEAAVFADAIEVDGLNLIAADRISGATRTEAVVRYNARPTPSEILPMDGSVAENGGRVLVRFDAPVRAPARGQAAVFYNGDVVLGGGRVAGRIESPKVRTEG
jgi:tRNA-specific 2-thiouridylase